MNKPVEINETTLRETIATVLFLDPEDIGVADNFGEDLGIDSIDRLQLLAAVEERHGVRLRDEQITNILSLSDLVKALEPVAGDGKS